MALSLSSRPTKRKRGEFPRPLELFLVEVVLKIKDLLEFKGVLFHYFQDGSAFRAGYTPPNNCLRLTQTELCPTNRTSRPGHVNPHLEGFPGWLGWPGCLGFFSLSSITTTPF